MKIQNEIGRKTEKEAAIFFKKHKYLAIPIPKSVNGQPFDIIASRKRDTWFLDVKHLESDKVSFPFSRIESNQITSMNYASIVSKISSDRLGFSIKWDREPEKYFYFSWHKFLECKKNNEKSIKMIELVDIEGLLCTQ